MNITTNIVAVTFGGSRRAVGDRILHQRDRGQILTFPDLADRLPSAFQVWFANHPENGSAVPQTGADGSVAIPDTLVATGLPIWAWLYLHAGEDDGETCYTATILNTAQPTFSGATPTPSQASAWDEAIAELNDAIEAAEAVAGHGPQIVDGYWYIWDASAGEYVNTNVRAEGESAVVDPTLSHAGEAADAAATGAVKHTADRALRYVETLNTGAGIPLDATWERGNINTNGNNTAGNLYRIRTVDTLHTDVALDLVSDVGYNFNVTFYNAQGEKQSATNNVFQLTVAAGSYFRVVVRKVTEDSSSTADVAAFSAALHIRNRCAATTISYDYDYIQYRSIAHRGAADVAPENTLPAFEAARDQGFDFCETDLGITSDGVLCCLHNDTINSVARNPDGTTISGTVYLRNITYAQALQYDFTAGLPGFEGTKICTMAAFLACCKAKGMYPYIELKNGISPTQAEIEKLIDLVRSYGMQRAVTYISVTQGLLRAVVSYDPTARVLLTGTAFSAAAADNVLPLRTGHNRVGRDVTWASIVSAGTAALEAVLATGIDVEIYSPPEDLTDVDTRILGVTGNGTPYAEARGIVYHGGGGVGTSDYTDLSNKPKINSVTLSGNKSLSDLGIEPEAMTVTITESGGSYSADKTYAQIMAAVAAGKRVNAVLDGKVYGYYTEQGYAVMFTAQYDTSAKLVVIDFGGGVTVQSKTLGTYSKPVDGIPKTDLSEEVQTSLGKADTALAAPESPSAGDVLTYANGAWDAAAPAAEVFWCTYGTTTSAQIEAAYQAGKLVMVIYNSIVYQLTYRGTSTSHTFGAAKTQTASTIYTVDCASDVWSASSKNLIPAPASPSSGDFLVYNGSAWAAMTLSTWQGGSY